MKTIGIISDVHNNVVALDAILEIFKQRNCDYILCCGDILSIGPFPYETVEQMMNLQNLICVCGNHDRYLCEGIFESPETNKEEIEHHKWEKTKLTEAQKNFIGELPKRIDLCIEKINISVLHYAMNENNKYASIVRNLSEDSCMLLFENEKADIIIFGHDHKKNYFEIKGQKFINCGALGCPSKRQNIAAAGILTLRDGASSFEFIETAYNVKTVLAEIDKLNYPCADYIKSGFYGCK